MRLVILVICAAVLVACSSLTFAQTPKPGEVFQDCEKCPEMVVVPSGKFTMGSLATEENHPKNEEPQHEVTIAKPFAVGRFAATFKEWHACVADGGCKGYRPADEGWGRGWRPVINVSWDDAKTYVTWLSAKTGKTYRLLSEAEREYVTRAGTTTPYWWGSGSSISARRANYSGVETVPVDFFQPNPWGLYQVHGNVYDWTEDCYHDSYTGAPTDGSAWASSDCRGRVLRGGSWLYSPWFLRAVSREWNSADFRGIGFSFRVGRAL
jgi:formylglycine-generating enzyme required for sulfatase activity